MKVKEDFEGLQSKNTIDLSKKNKTEQNYEDNLKNVQKIIPVEIPLTSILNNHKISIQGDFLLIRSPIDIDIRINNNTNQPIKFSDKDILETTFNDLYITTYSTYTQNLKLFIGVSSKIILADSNKVFSIILDSNTTSFINPFIYTFPKPTLFKEFVIGWYMDNFMGEIWFYNNTQFILNLHTFTSSSNNNIYTFYPFTGGRGILKIDLLMEIKSIKFIFSTTIHNMFLTGIKV